MIDVIAGPKSRRVVRSQAIGYGKVVLAIAVAERDLILLRGDEVRSDIEIIEIPEALAVAFEVLQNHACSTRLGEPLKILQPHRVRVGDDVGCGGAVPSKGRASWNGPLSDRIEDKALRNRIPLHVKSIEVGRVGQGAGRDTREVHVSCTQELTEVPHAHLVSWNRGKLDANGLVLTAPLIVAKDKEFVLPDRRSQSASELALPESDRAGLAIRFGLPKPASTEQEGRPVNLIGARLDAGLHDCASPAAELSGGHPRSNPEFLDGFSGGKEND